MIVKCIYSILSKKEFILNILITCVVGIISLLDEECLRPGDPNDLSFLEKMTDKLNHHKHFISHQKADIKVQKIMSRVVWWWSNPLKLVKHTFYLFGHKSRGNYLIENLSNAAGWHDKKANFVSYIINLTIELLGLRP